MYLDIVAYDPVRHLAFIESLCSPTTVSIAGNDTLGLSVVLNASQAGHVQSWNAQMERAHCFVHVTRSLESPTGSGHLLGMNFPCSCLCPFRG